MRTWMVKRSCGMGILAGIALVAAAGLAHAELTKKVSQKYRGQILVTDNALNFTVLGDSSQTIKTCEKNKLKVVKHEEVGGTPTWTFYYTAFLNAKPRVGTLTMEFYYDMPGEGLELRADKTMVGIDRSLKILQGRISISEDDNVSAGKTYVVKLVDNLPKSSKTYATTKLTFK